MQSEDQIAHRHATEAIHVTIRISYIDEAGHDGAPSIFESCQPLSVTNALTENHAGMPQALYGDVNPLSFYEASNWS